MNNKKLIGYLKEKALLIRKDIVFMIGCGTGHAGGALSSTDLVTVLYFHQMKHDPKNPSWEDRDRFILSKGHSAPLLYAVLAETGYFDKNKLKTLRKFGSYLQGHPDMRFENPIPGIEISTGELGQGLSVGAGIALAGRINKKDYKVYTLLGDGEIQEGQVWEAAMFSSHYNISNLIAIIDNNGLQIDGYTKDVMNINPIAEKWKAFGWETIEINGHDISEILDAYDRASKNKRPTVIIAKTIKGKGISDWENNVASHHIHGICEEDVNKYLQELNGGYDE